MENRIDWAVLDLGECDAGSDPWGALAGRRLQLVDDPVSDGARFRSLLEYPELVARAAVRSAYAHGGRRPCLSSRAGRRTARAA